ncbi:T9SS type A sorting domain-containing protein, partial [Nonlabens mediterrranea]|nr:T9SS type A sorting domain-containing protein [Nonlabens mediterrranea]
PNPFTTSTSFQLPIESAVVEIRVYDLYGRTVDHKSIKTTNNSKEFEYHSPDLHTGLYHFNIVTDQGRKFTGKFLIN